MVQGFAFAKLGPWPAGMAVLGSRLDVPVDALFDAADVDVMPTGAVESRVEWVEAQGGVTAHSIFEHGGIVYGVIDGYLSTLSEFGYMPFHPVDQRITWTVLNGYATFASADGVFRVHSESVTSVSGVVRTDDDMDDPLVPMPGGQWVDYWNGRLLVARGPKLLFSRPLRYGAHNPMIDYVMFPQYIEWIAPVANGIFVGTADKVFWLAGRTPSDMTMQAVAGKTAPGVALVVDGTLVGGGLSGQVAIFLTTSGFAVGLPSGEIQYPQAKYIKDLPLFRGRLFRVGSRIFAVKEI